MEMRQHAGCVVKDGTKDGNCVRLTSADCEAMHTGKQQEKNTKVCTSDPSIQYPTLCHAVSSENSNFLNITAIVTRETECPNRLGKKIDAFIDDTTILCRKVFPDIRNISAEHEKWKFLQAIESMGLFASLIHADGETE